MRGEGSLRRRARDALVVDEILDSTLDEGDQAVDDSAFVVEVDELAGDGVEELSVERRDGEDLADEGERVQSDAETVDAEAAVSSCGVEGGKGLLARTPRCRCRRVRDCRAAPPSTRA